MEVVRVRRRPQDEPDEYELLEEYEQLANLLDEEDVEDDDEERDEEEE